MPSDDDELIRRIKKEVNRIKSEEPEIGEAIAPIVLTNLSEGRIENFLENGSSVTVEEYIQRIVRYHGECYEFIRKLEDEDREAWEEFLNKLAKWAFSFLRKKGVPESADRYQIAADCAHVAGGRLTQIRFPYDVHYEGWACKVTHYVCLKYIRDNAPKIKYVDNDLSEMDGWLGALSQPSETGRTDKRLDIEAAIKQLGSEDRKILIRLLYFEGKDFDAIAEIMGRTKNALYKLHFDALADLRNILGEKGGQGRG